MEATKKTMKQVLIEEVERMPEGANRQQLLKDLAKADENATLKDLWHITPEMLEYIYSQARQDYLRKDYKKASSMFRLLHTIDAHDDRLAMGIAASEHMLNNWEEAVMWYLKTDRMAIHSPLPQYHASDCYQKLNMPEYAADALRQALEKCKLNPMYKDLQGKIELLLESQTVKGEKK